jgi:hypothetical protein
MGCYRRFGRTGRHYCQGQCDAVARNGAQCVQFLLQCVHYIPHRSLGAPRTLNQLDLLYTRTGSLLVLGLRLPVGNTVMAREQTSVV